MFGPLFHKELLETSRRRRYFLARILVGCGLLLIQWTTMRNVPSVKWTPARSQNRAFRSQLLVNQFGIGQSSAAQFQAWQRTMALYGASQTAPSMSTAELSVIGQGIFDSWAMAVVWGIFLLTPAMVGGLIAGEKDGRTFEVLLTTRLGNREILFGKLASRLFLLLVLLLSSYPVLAIASLFGGFDQWSIAQAVYIHLSLLIFAAALSLCQSVVARKPYVAMLRSYILLIVFWWVIPTAIGWAGSGPLGNNNWMSFVRMLSPSQALATIGQPVLDYPNDLKSTIFPAPTATMWNPVTWFVGPGRIPKNLHLKMLPSLCLLGAGFFFLRAVRLLRQERFWAGDPWILRLVRWIYHGAIDGIRGTIERRKNFFGLKHLWQAEVASQKIGRLEYWFGEPSNPITVRNRSSNAYDPEKFVAVLQTLLWIGCVGALLYGGLSHDLFLFESHFQELIAQGVGACIVLLAVLLTASAFARERQYGSWEALLLTSIKPGEFLNGARRGIVAKLLPTFVLLAVMILLFGFSSVRTLNVAAVLVVGWLALQMVMRVALLNSLLHTRIALAMATTALSVLALPIVGVALQVSRFGPMLAFPAATWLLRMATGRRLFTWLASIFALVYCTPLVSVEWILVGGALTAVAAFLPWLDRPGKVGTWFAGVLIPTALFTLAAVAAPHVMGYWTSGLSYYWDGELRMEGTVLFGDRGTAWESGFGLLGGFFSLTTPRWDIEQLWPAYLLLVVSLVLANLLLEVLMRRRFDSLAGRSFVRPGPVPWPIATTAVPHQPGP